MGYEVDRDPLESGGFDQTILGYASRTDIMPAARIVETNELLSKPSQLLFLDYSDPVVKHALVTAEKLRSKYYVEKYISYKLRGYNPAVVDGSLRSIYEERARITEKAIQRVEKHYEGYKKISELFKKDWQEMIDRGLWKAVLEVLGPLSYTERTFLPTFWGTEGSNWVRKTTDDGPDSLPKFFGDGVIFINYRSLPKGRESRLERKKRMVHEFIAHAATQKLRENTLIDEADSTFQSDKEWFMDEITAQVMLRLGYYDRLSDIPRQEISKTVHDSTRNAFYRDLQADNLELKHPQRIDLVVDEINQGLNHLRPRISGNVRRSPEMMQLHPHLLFLNYDDQEAVGQRLVAAETHRLFYYFDLDLLQVEHRANLDAEPFMFGEEVPTFRVRGSSYPYSYVYVHPEDIEIRRYLRKTKLAAEVIRRYYQDYQQESREFENYWNELLSKGVLDIAARILGPLPSIEKTFIPTAWGSGGSNWTRHTFGYQETGLADMFGEGIIFVRTIPIDINGKKSRLEMIRVLVHEFVAHALTEQLRVDTVICEDININEVTPYHHPDKEWLMDEITSWILYLLGYVDRKTDFTERKPYLSSLVHDSTKDAFYVNPSARPSELQLKYPGRFDLCVREVHDALKDTNPRR